MTPRPGEAQPGWWARNWFWALPGGCLGCLGLTLGGCALLVGGLFGAVRTSTEFQQVISQIESDPRVVEELGEPIEAGWFFQGNIQVNDDQRVVDIKVPISGPNGNGFMHVAGEEIAGEWRFDTLEVEFASGGSVDLLEKPDSAPSDDAP